MTLDWHLVIGSLGGVIALLAILPYVKDILHGTTRPNIFSFSLWAVLLFISILAQWSAGASWSLALLVGDFIGTSIIVALCLFGYGYKKYGRLEWICTGLALIALVSWQLTQQPVLAICFAVVADGMAAIPTVVKAYRDPWSEEPAQWLLIAFGAVLAILSTTMFNPANLLFPTYLLVVNGTTGLLTFFGRRIVKK